MVLTGSPLSHPEPIPNSEPTKAIDPRRLRPIHHILRDPAIFAFEISDSRVSVPEATIDSISSKLTFTLCCKIKNHVNTRTAILYRTLDQIVWLQEELLRESPFIALGLPRTLLENQICFRTEMITLENLLETKRFQVERYFTRLLARADVFSLKPWKVFLSDSIDQYFISPIERDIFDQVKIFSADFYKANKNNLRLLPRIKAQDTLDDSTLFEVDEFQLKRQFIRSEEASFIASRQGVAQLQSSRERLSLNLSRLGDFLIGALHSRHRLGPLTKAENKYDFKSFDLQLEMLATLFDDLNFIAYRQGQAEANKLGSVFEDYVETLTALRACFNNCIDQWSAHLKQTQASLEREDNATKFKRSHDKLNAEFATYTTFKTGDVKSILRQFATLQLNLEKAKLNVLKVGLSSTFSKTSSPSTTSFGIASASLHE